VVAVRLPVFNVALPEIGDPPVGTLYQEKTGDIAADDAVNVVLNPEQTVNAPVTPEMVGVGTRFTVVDPFIWILQFVTVLVAQIVNTPDTIMPEKLIELPLPIIVIPVGFPARYTSYRTLAGSEPDRLIL
jgi:hypothetical protein